MRHPVLFFALLLSIGFVFGDRGLSDDLGQTVRSLFSNRCFACHGPDAEQREGGFRLDERSSFIGEADSGEIPVVPGQPNTSELIRRLEAEDPDERMPPAGFGVALSQEEIQQVREWIALGANYSQHWSYIAPQRPSTPSFTHPQVAQYRDWLMHPIDRFLLAKQLQHGLSPSLAATRAELLRRVTLDLTGLPPSPQEVFAFVKDPAPNAYESQVDRLLASPAYGEHWARKWLDLARYADSAGYADDPPRTIWAYRDWVVQALNDDMSIKEFTVQQLAGDLLPDATENQLVATAFHRNTLTNNEGGTNDEEFRNVAIVDRVNTTMAVWMGVTMACAQCHSHKYDPLTQEEYFKLFAIFNQSQDADRRDESPVLQLFTQDQKRLKQQWQTRLMELDLQLGKPTNETRREQAKWERDLQQPKWSPLVARSFKSTSKSNAELRDDGTILVHPIGNNIVRDSYTIEFELEDKGTSFLRGLAVRTVPDQALPRGGAGLGRGNFVVTGVKGTLTPKGAGPPRARFVRVELPGRNRILSLAELQVFSREKNVAAAGKASQSSTDYDGDAARAIDGNTDGDYTKNSTTHTAKSTDPWWELDLGAIVEVDRLSIWNRRGGGIHSRLNGAQISLLDQDRSTVFTQELAVAGEAENVIAVNNVTPIHFTKAFADFEQKGFAAENVVDNQDATGWAVEGAVASSHLLTLIPEKPIQIAGAAHLKLEIDHNSTHRHHLLGSFRVERTGSANVSDWAAMSPKLRRIHKKPVAERTKSERAELSTFFARHLAPSHADMRKEVMELDRKVKQLKPATSVPVMRERDEDLRRETYIQVRGNYKSLSEKVKPGTPAVFHSLGVGQAEVNRLLLAEWLVDRRNPLTARVWMNRLWESLFGIGIVRSSEEFGAQGERPTHPELLDWLAVEFMDSGWNQKRMLRLLVTSQAYRQTSQVTQEVFEIDKDNVWLSRGPRVRLSAEMVRDQALAAAGLLTRKMYGEPVRPPQPNMGLKAAFGSATDWATSTGEDRYRRGLYTTWRRSNPYPSMVTFDAPSREVCTLRRDRTNTPLQALVTLNDPGFFEAAQGLARRIVLEEYKSADDQTRVRAAFQICTSRDPEPKELDVLVRLLHRVREQLLSDPEAAKALATEPLGPLPSSADPVELAAFTTLSNVLLNLDEVLMKR